MAEKSVMDEVNQFLMESMVAKSSAPHYTEIAKKFSVSPEEGRSMLQELMATGIPAWLFPNTDYVSSFPPFSNLPTQYRITIEGQQNWYAQ